MNLISYPTRIISIRNQMKFLCPKKYLLVQARNCQQLCRMFPRIFDIEIPAL